MKRTLLFATSLLFSSLGSGAQDVHFSQFYETATLRNPALVGVFSGDYKAGATHRNQWSNLGIPFVSTNVSAEGRLIVLPQTNDFLSFGFNALFDKAGSVDFATNTFYGAVNYNKALGTEHHTFLSVGLAGGYNQRSVDVSKMRFSSQYNNGVFDANNGAASQVTGNVVRQFDAGAGISLNGSLKERANYYLGIAGYHLSKPDDSYLGQDFVRLSTRWNANAGAAINLSERTALIVHGQYQLQNPYQQLLLGGYVRSAFGNLENPQNRMAVSAGCFYRSADAVIPTLRLEFSRFLVNASYDVPLTAGRIYTSGMSAFEVSLFVRGMFPQRKDNPLACPRFEGLLQNQPSSYMQY